MSDEKSIQSMGGDARKNALSPEQRSEIAKTAAESRWLPKAIYGTPEKKLKLGDRELECYVLEGGKRVLSGRGMQEALGLGQSHGGLLKEFLENDNIKPFIGNELAMEFLSPLRFIRPGRGGIPALAYDAMILPRICDAVLEARKQNKKLGKRQAEIADQCEIITRVLAKVGIIALVDEVTGYQEVRNKEALQALLDAFLQKEFAAWAKRFPDEFYRQIFRLRGWEWNRLSVKRPMLVGKLTNDVVYERLAPGVLAELENRNPKDERGKRKSTHHQWLTEDVGHPALAQHLHAIIGLMRASSTWKQFHDMLNRAFPKKGEVFQIDLFENERM
jgi:hypothetical protein